MGIGTIEISGQGALSWEPFSVTETVNAGQLTKATLQLTEQTGMPTGGGNILILPEILEFPLGPGSLRGGIYGGARFGSLRGTASTFYVNSLFDDKINRGATFRNDHVIETGMVVDATRFPLGQGFYVGPQFRLGAGDRSGTVTSSNQLGQLPTVPISMSMTNSVPGSLSISPIDFFNHTPYHVTTLDMSALLQISKDLVGPLGVKAGVGIENHTAFSQSGFDGTNSMNALFESGLILSL